MNRNFEQFAVGHWYVYTGTDKHSCFVRGQEFVLDHKANKCIKASNVYRADFDRGHSDTSLPFTWEGLSKNNCFDNWIEVEDPTIAHSITSGEYYYGRLSKTIREYDCCASGNIGSNSNSHYKLSRSPYGEIKVENKKEEFIPKKVKLSDNDDIWIECARPEELPCECYVQYEAIKPLNIFAKKCNIVKINTISYNTAHEYDGYIHAIPKARADEALKFVCNVKISDLKPGVKVKIKEDAEWMDKYNPQSFKKGGIYTVESTDRNDWGMWSDTIKGAVTLKESGDYRFPIHWIEKIVDEKDIVLNRAKLFDKAEQKIQASSKIKISELKNKTDYAVYVKSNEERIKFMSAVGINWNNGDSFEKNKCTYPTHMVKRSYYKGMLWELSTLEPAPTIYNMSDIDFEEDKVYIKGTDFYIGEKVRVKKYEDIHRNLKGFYTFKDSMKELCNQIVTITPYLGIHPEYYNCATKEGGYTEWHTDWFEHIDEKNVNVSDSSLKIEVKGHCLNTKVFEELFIYPKHKSKYIKLNKKPIKKGKEYKVHKKEYIPLNK